MKMDANGLAPRGKKILRQTLKQLGVGEDDLPGALKDRVLMKGKKGKLGQIVVREVTGVENNAAARTARQFQENCGGKEDIAEKLAAVSDSLPKEQLALLTLLREPGSKKMLPRLLAESGTELAGVMGAYARGALMLGQIEAITEAARNLPRVIKDLAVHALDGTGACEVCAGSGSVAPKKGSREESQPCPLCKGAGTRITSSKHKEFAVQKILEVGKMIEKAGPMVQVNQQVGVKVEKSGATMEMVAQMAEKILHGRMALPQGEIMEAEVVDAPDVQLP